MIHVYTIQFMGSVFRANRTCDDCNVVLIGLGPFGVLLPISFSNYLFAHVVG